MGERTDDDSTKATEPPGSSAAHTSRAIRTAPRKTELEGRLPGLVGGARHRAGRRAADRDQRAVEPSERLARGLDQPGRRARVGVVGHHGDGRVAEVGDGSVEDSALRPDSTTLAPSATSASAVARPSRGPLR